MHNTGHVMLINNAYDTPHIFLIQEKNKHWGIFGGRQERTDESLTTTAVRELYEESCGSLKGNPDLFPYLDTYWMKNPLDGSVHQTFVTVNSRIQEADILVDAPGQDGLYGDIKQGKFFPLDLILDTIYSGKKTFIYNDEENKFRYFFAETLKRNREISYEIFQKHNLAAMETRHRLLNIEPVVSVKREMISSFR